jgi:GNAT superfamily N-acetyltransferase
MAVSDRDLPPGIAARALREDDLPAAGALVQEAHWNQIAADWRIFLELGDAICLTRNGGPPIATAAMLPYRAGFAWISMVLVTSVERRQGLAQWLLRRCIRDLAARGLVPMLDATPAGRAVYSGLGFVDCWPMKRFVARGITPPKVTDSVTIRPIEVRDWPQLAAYDAAIFGADRSTLLQRLAVRLPAAALLAERGGHLTGYLFGRDGRVMSQLGPLTAEDDSIARSLIAHAICAVGGTIAIDVPDQHTVIADWLGNALGFAVERPFTRMSYGAREIFGETRRLFAIAGPELG